MHTCWHLNPKNSVLNQTPSPFREELSGWVVFHTFLSLGIIWRQAEQETPGLRGTSELFLYTLPVGICHLFHPSEKHLCMCEMFACELFSLSTVVILLQIPKKRSWTKQKTTVADPTSPPPNTYVTLTHLGGQHYQQQQIPAEFFPTILCSMFPHPRYSSWLCAFNIELRLFAETLASGII